MPPRTKAPRERATEAPAAEEEIRRPREFEDPDPIPDAGSFVSTMEALQKLRRDLKTSARTLGKDEARFLVDSYYALQQFRISSAHQVRQLTESGEPTEVLSFFGDQFETLEKQIKGALDAYSDGQLVGRWAKSITGIGPVITAGLLAHIDIKEAPTVGHIWRYAGLDPTSVWDKGEKRPWNASLKTLCVVPGSYVTTRRGHLPIEEIVIGDEVLTHLGRWRKVLQTFVNDFQGSIHGLRSANAGNAVAWLTPGHPVHATEVSTWQSGRTYKVKPASRQEYGWHAVESIQPRWSLSRPTCTERTANLPVLVLDGVAVENEAKVAAGGRWENVPAPRATAVPHIVPLDQEMMFLIGLYLAEGHVSRGYIGWSLHIDELDLQNRVISTLKEKFGLQAYITCNQVHKSAQVMVGCKPLATAIAEKFGTDSFSVRFPMDWLSLPDELLKSLWDGIMAGDGDHVGEFKNRRISTINGKLARQIVDLGRRLGMSVALHAEKENKAFRIHVNDRDDRNPPARTSLISTYSGPVHNLEVEEDHSYLVEGYAVHNCWKIGESFVKVSSREKDIYGKVYLERKALDQAKNEAGAFKIQAAELLKTKNFRRETVARAAYEIGKLPPGHIHARAKRWAVKLFLAHLHHVWYEVEYNTKPPKPYIIEHGGHTHFIAPPNWAGLTK
jgi:Transposase IS116/IS110/IS902 family